MFQMVMLSVPEIRLFIARPKSDYFLFGIAGSDRSTLLEKPQDISCLWRDSEKIFEMHPKMINFPLFTPHSGADDRHVLEGLSHPNSRILRIYSPTA